MLDLIFLTSNVVKIAHVRYVFSRLPIRVIGFRQRTYHANYIEPRMTSRKELLEFSYRSALEQCRKAGIATNSHFFMLEDTSVRIEALSTSSQDVPGLDIKYWMEEITFPNLDRELHRTGNDRRAYVQSDVLLYIPDIHKSRLNVAEDYCIFTGRQEGYVIESELHFESNVVFPWLDNRTFNKWFCPVDSKLPLGALNIGEADKVDFRRKALRQMSDFLDDGMLIERSAVQMKLSLDDDINLVVCGYTCAGKTTASQHLARIYGYVHIEASDFMHLSYYHRHGYGRDIAIGDFAEQALAQMPHIVAENVAEYVLEEELAPIVVSGFRSIAEIIWMKEYLAFLGKRFKLVFVDAEQSERYIRMRLRNRTGDGMSLDDFRRKDEQQRRMGLGKIEENGNIEIWKNNGSLECYLKHIDSQIVLECLEDSEIEELVGELKNAKIVKLEDAILVTLLSVWTMDETRRFFSTMEIANIMNNKIFPGIQPKHRENVHRYFNQDFYAYYEIGTRSRGRVRVYRLSNTGYGRALRALRSMKGNLSCQSTDATTEGQTNEGEVLFR